MLRSKSKSQVTCRRHNINIDVKVDPHRESGTAVKYIFGPITAGVSRVSEKTIWFLEYCLAWGLDMSHLSQYMVKRLRRNCASNVISFLSRVLSKHHRERYFPTQHYWPSS